MSRPLPVTDATRSVAFYRDLLGFRVQDTGGDSRDDTVAELVRGAARLDVVPAHAGGVETAEILFFQTDNVAALHEEVASRGARPTSLERVNWIKMEMFQLTDPDGHTLWFGQSFHVPNETTPEPMMWKALPELPVSDVRAAVAHYRDVLGFRVNYAQDSIGVMDRDQITVLLIARAGQDAGRDIGSCYCYVRDADALHAELTSSGANVLDAPVSHPWGLRDFHVLDSDGNRITFGQPFE
jgi:catechol 2,3-dioxygenase-like lactoylglutathione lyase family enzyme